MKYYKKMTRPLPLYSVEYWFSGDKSSFAKLTNKKLLFNPIFVHNNQKSVEIYYNKDYDKNIIAYFEKNPNFFFKYEKQYLKDCLELRKLSTNKNKDIKQIFNKIIKIWPIMMSSFILGKYKSNSKLKIIANEAYKLRKKNEKILYLAGNSIYDYAKQQYPKIEQYLDYLKFNEIYSGKIPKLDILKERKQGYLFYNQKLLLKKDKKKIELKILKLKSIKLNTTIIIGKSASKGKVMGRAKLLFEIDQIDKVKKGDIIVSPETVPDFLPAMIKAKAFVTDEGGITCHAAIAAREFNKPCVVGTLNATKIIKDNDLIEVDATKGQIRIISRK